jgi:hypothetical protein
MSQDPDSEKAIPDRGRIAPRCLLRFLAANAGRLKPREVDKSILRLIALQKEYLKIYERRLFSGADGFILSSSKGMADPEIDYPCLSARFGRYASQPVAGYLRIMARETAQHFATAQFFATAQHFDAVQYCAKAQYCAKDAVLKIGPDTLGRRIAAVETYLRENRRFVRSNEVRELGQQYLTAYLVGMNNTPAFSSQTNRLNNRFYQSYQYSITKYPGTKFADLVKEYLNLLAENGFQKTKPVLDFATRAAAII